MLHCKAHGIMGNKEDACCSAGRAEGGPAAIREVNKHGLRQGKAAIYNLHQAQAALACPGRLLSLRETATGGLLLLLAQVDSRPC